MVKKFNELNESKSDYDYLNKRVIDELSILGIIYAIKTGNMDLNKYSKEILKYFEDFLSDLSNDKIENDFKELLGLMIDDGVDMLTELSYGHTILMTCVLYGNLEILEFLIVQGVDYKSKNEDGENIFSLYEREMKRNSNYPNLNIYPTIYKLYNEWKQVKKFKI